MSSPLSFQKITLNEVFERLDAGATVVTPNRRLASALKDKFDRYQIEQNKVAWCSADILPFSALIKRHYLDTLYSERASKLPLLLTPTQEQVLWESVIQSSDAGKSLLKIPQTAELVREAWQLAHAWQFVSKLSDFYPNEDTRAFLEWAAAYEQLTLHHQQTDSARVCDLITEQYASSEIKKPDALIAYGFDIFTPQQQAFLNQPQLLGYQVLTANTLAGGHNSTKQIQRVGYVNCYQEIYQAAIWARTRLEADDNVQIGIIVPALSNYRNAIVRIFTTVMRPDVTEALLVTEERLMPFNLSLGSALTAYPLIDTAFSILSLVSQKLEFEQISHLLRSPFLAGAEVEMNQRALLDAKMRQYADPVMSLPQLVALIEQVNGSAYCPILVQHLSALSAFKRNTHVQMGRHGELVQIVSAILQLVGFPGERGLNSTEHQTINKWHELLTDFATLDCVKQEVHFNEAVSYLRRMAMDTLFQPETPDVPIQILGVLEAEGICFDHLWVMGLSEEQWPLRPRPNPFLPLELQRSMELPLGSTHQSYARSERLTNGWLSSANEVILSYPQHSDDRDGHVLKPSPLIKFIQEKAPVLPSYISHRDLIIESGKLESVIDDQVPPLSNEVLQTTVSGGTALIKDYAACPFRAWAKHRLNADGLKTPRIGLNAMERGSLVHDVLAQAWHQLKSKDTLDTISDTGLQEILVNAANRAIQSMKRKRPNALPERFASIEQQRLVKLAQEWLAIEKQREFFTVITVEDKRCIQVGGLKLETRLDRVDQLDNGQTIIIDYKTSKQSVVAMIGDRPQEPQLPLYVVMTSKLSVGVAFATVKRGQMEFSAIIKDAGLLPGIKSFSDLTACKHFNSWDELIATWQQDLTKLAKDFVSGHVQVDPKNYPVTCDYCDMQSFCRINERVSGKDGLR